MGTIGRQHGVTLVELMISLALLSLLTVGVLAIWGQSQQAYLEGAEAADVQQRVRLAMDEMVRAIQAAGANPTNQTYAGATANDPAFVAFREAGPWCVRLYSDQDGDGAVRGSNENRVFNWSSVTSTLTQESGGGPDTGALWVNPAAGPEQLAWNLVANPGNAPIFQFFTSPGDAAPNTLIAMVLNVDPCGNTMTDVDRARIGRVVITLTASGRVGNQTIKRTLVSEARPRNVP